MRQDHRFLHAAPRNGVLTDRLDQFTGQMLHLSYFVRITINAIVLGGVPLLTLVVNVVKLFAGTPNLAYIAAPFCNVSDSGTPFERSRGPS